MTAGEVAACLACAATGFAVGILALWELEHRWRSRRRGGIYGKDWP
jgi:hypothetical protein